MASTTNGARLTELERQAFLAEWAYIKQRARFLAVLLGFENPFPVRKEIRNGRGEIKPGEIRSISE